jgi:hypothetical protein
VAAVGPEDEGKGMSVAALLLSRNGRRWSSSKRFGDNFLEDGDMAQGYARCSRLVVDPVASDGVE